MQSTGGAGTMAGLALAPATGGASLLIGAGVDLATSILSTVMSWKAAKDNIEAQKATNAQQMALYREQQTESKREGMVEEELTKQKLGTETDLAYKKLSTEKELAKAKLKQDTEIAKFNRYLAFSEMLHNQFSQNHIFKDRVLSLTKARVA